MFSIEHCKHRVKCNKKSPKYPFLNTSIQNPEYVINTSKTNNNVNTLAKTGLSDTNGIVALIVVVCGVSAIYSYKKVNDYKKL